MELVSWDYEIPKVLYGKNVPNHQPVVLFTGLLF